MVLDNSSESRSDDLSDDQPPSDGDTYSSSPSTDEEGHVVYNIDINKYPRRIRFLSPFDTTPNDKDPVLREAIHNRIQRMAVILKRNPTVDEVDAMAYWTSRQIAISAYSLPIGITAAVWRTYSTRHTFNFPFYKPDLEKLNPTAFPSSRMSWLSGTLAKQAWHCSRLVAYMAAANLLAGFTVGSYAASVAAVGCMSDKRLQTYGEAMKAQVQTQRGRINNLPNQKVPTANGQHDDNSPSWKSPEDDASPTGGAYQDMDTNYVGDRAGAGQYGRMDGRTSMEDNTREARQNPISQTKSSNDGDVAFPMESEPRDFDMGFDDASPTGGERVTDTQSTGGSAWERIRQQAQTGRSPRSVGPGQKTRNPVAAQEQPANESSSADNYSFSSTDRERQIARDEAQKEFDARVERERRGGDFSSGSGDQKRW